MSRRGRAQFPLHTFPGNGHANSVVDTLIENPNHKDARHVIETRLASDGVTAKIVAVDRNNMLDVVMIGIEGPHLPAWRPGSNPWSMRTYDEMIRTWRDNVSPFKGTETDG